MNAFISMLVMALYAMLIQNLVFTAAYGITETIRIAKKPKYFIMYTVSVMIFSTATSVICYILDRIETIQKLSEILHYAIFTAVLAVIYLLGSAIVLLFFHANKKFMNSLGMCAINSLVLAVPIINMKANFSLSESIGTGVGAGLAFMLSILLINSGMKHIANNKNIPEIFRGTPVLFIYVSFIALILAAISKESLFV